MVSTDDKRPMMLFHRYDMKQGKQKHLNLYIKSLSSWRGPTGIEAVAPIKDLELSSRWKNKLQNH